jgi:hypothetical protein
VPVVYVLLFLESSLPAEAAFIGALARGHRFGEVSIERGADFLEPELV